MFVLIRHYEQQRLTKIIESPFICFEHFLLPRELYSLVFRFKKNQPSQEMFGHFEWNSSQVCFFKNCLAVDFFALGASNWLESVAPIFLNCLADLCLVSDNFGGRWDSRPNSAREIQDTGYNRSDIRVFEDKDLRWIANSKELGVQCWQQ